MKLLLCIAETPYLNEWFSEMVKVLKEPPYSVEFILYFSSELAYRDKSYLFPYDSKNYRFMKEKDDDANLIPLKLDWSISYISWERQWYQKAMKYNTEKIRHTVHQLHASISKIILKERPDFVLYELPSSILGEILYAVCEASGFCDYLSVTQSRIPSRIDICDDKYKYKKMDCFTSIPNDEEIIAMSYALISRKVVPSYMADNANSRHSVSLLSNYLPKMKRLIFYVKNLLLLLNCNDYETREAYGMVWANFRNHLLIRLRKDFVERYYTIPKSGEKYYLFPLHLVPESSVSGQAMYYSNILSTIRYIAFSLPIDTILYVREHPAAVGTRSNNFYKEIRKLPNVRLISYKVQASKLIEGCEAVITLTSTMGLEAALAGKIVYIIGDVVYENHPNCIKVSTIEELRLKLKNSKLLNLDSSLEYINTKFMKEYYSNSIEGNILIPNNKSDYFEFFKMLNRKKGIEFI